MIWMNFVRARPGSGRAYAVKAASQRITLTRRLMAGGITGFPVMAVAGHGLAGVAVAAGAVLVTALMVLAPELFWFGALRQSSRDLRWLISNTSPDNAERLGQMFQKSSQAVLEARVRQRDCGRPGALGGVTPTLGPSSRKRAPTGGDAHA
jgi:hypothetical protein